METRSQKWHKLKTKRWVLEIKLEATSTKNVHDHKLSNFLPDSKHNFVNKVMKWGGTSQLGPFCESVSLWVWEDWDLSVSLGRQRHRENPCAFVDSSDFFHSPGICMLG